MMKPADNLCNFGVIVVLNFISIESLSIAYIALQYAVLIYQNLILLFFLLDNTKKPGPDVYAPEKVTVNKRTAASYSMGVRHSEYTAPLIVDIPDN